MNVREMFESEVCEKCSNKECKKDKDTMAGCATIATYFVVLNIKDAIGK